MKKVFLGVVGVIVLIGSTSGTASAATEFQYYHGSVCHSPTASNLNYTQYGVDYRNTTGDSVTVFCPVPVTVPGIGGTQSLTTAFTVHDRGQSLRVSCTQQVIDTAGNVSMTETKTSSSGGIGTLSQTLTFFPVSVNINQPNIVISCSIPPAQVDQNNVMWVSHIVAFKVAKVLP